MKSYVLVITLFLTAIASAITLTPENVTGSIALKKDIRINDHKWVSSVKTMEISGTKGGTYFLDVTCSMSTYSPGNAILRELPLAPSEVKVSKGTMLEFSEEESKQEYTYIFSHKKTGFYFSIVCEADSNHKENTKNLKESDPLTAAMELDEVLINFKTTPSIISDVLGSFVDVNIRPIKAVVID